MTPDYSPEILKAFLHARVVFGAASAGISQPQAWRAVRAELRKATRLKVADLDAAYSGRLNLENTRTKIWAALNVYPNDFAVLLDNAGGQCPAPMSRGFERGDLEWSPAALRALDAHNSEGLK